MNWETIVQRCQEDADKGNINVVTWTRYSDVSLALFELFDEIYPEYIEWDFTGITAKVMEAEFRGNCSSGAARVIHKTIKELFDKYSLTRGQRLGVYW